MSKKGSKPTGNKKPASSGKSGKSLTESTAGKKSNITKRGGTGSTGPKKK